MATFWKTINFVHLYTKLCLQFRYKQNKEVLKLGMTKLGFEEFLDEKHDGYIITSYKFPKDENFNFSEFYNRLATEGTA